MNENKIPIFNSEEFAEAVADKVYEKTAGTFTEFMKNIEKGLSGIAIDISDIKERLTKNENKVTDEEKRIEDHEKRLNKKRDDIKELRDDYEKNKEHLEYVARVKPTLETLQNMFNFWTWKNWWKIAGIIFAILLVFALMVVGLNFYMHKNGMVTYGDKHSYTPDAIYSEMRTGGLSTIARGRLTKNYTDAQRDSIHEQNIQNMTRRIQEYNKK